MGRLVRKYDNNDLDSDEDNKIGGRERRKKQIIYTTFHSLMTASDKS